MTPESALEGSRASQVFSRAVAAVGVSVLGVRAIAVLGTLLVAAILTPKDFGYLAIVNVVVTLAQFAFGAAFTPALVHFQGAIEEVASTAFWTALGVSGLVYLVLWSVAPPLETYYGVEQLSILLRVSALSIVANSVGAVPLGLLQRRGEFKKFMLAGAGSQIACTFLTLVLALWGVGVWALVLGLLANAVVSAILAFFYAQWAPGLGLDFKRAKPLFGFSFWVIAGGIQTWLFLYGDNAIASRSFSAAVLGVYVVGFNLANTLPGLVLSAVSLVAYPSLCHANRISPAGVSSRFLDIQTVTATLVVPIACLSAALAKPVAALVFRATWVDLGFTIGWLAILPGACAIWSLNADGYRAIGRPDLWPKIAGVSLGLLLPCLAVAGRFGAHAFIVTRCVASLPLPLLNMAVADRVLRIPLSAQLARLLPAVIAGGFLWCTTSGLLLLAQPAALAFRVLYLGSCACAGIGVYLLVLRITGPGVWQCVLRAVGSLRSVPAAQTAFQLP